MVRGEKKEVNAKGQFTVFVLLGLVLLVVVVLILFFVSTLITAQLQRQGQQAIDDYLESQNINYYVYTCMDAAVQDAVNNFTLQGGVFYDGQIDDGIPLGNPGNDYIPYAVIGNDITDVHYAVKADPLCSVVDLIVPDYPKQRTKLADLQRIYGSTSACQFNDLFEESGFLGLNQFTRLCYSGSPNAVLLEQHNKNTRTIR